MEKIYAKILIWAIKQLVNREKSYKDRCKKLNNIINSLVDTYCDYTKEGACND